MQGRRSFFLPIIKINTEKNEAAQRAWPCRYKILEGNIASDFDLLNPADIANVRWQGSPLYEIMWRGWKSDGKCIITNRR